jgi:hypothetical protein
VSRASDEAEGFRHISWLSAMLFRIFGPAHIPDGPLVGTRYDPAYRQRLQRGRAEARRAATRQRRHQVDLPSAFEAGRTRSQASSVAP